MFLADIFTKLQTIILVVKFCIMREDFDMVIAICPLIVLFTTSICYSVYLLAMIPIQFIISWKQGTSKAKRRSLLLSQHDDSESLAMVSPRCVDKYSDDSLGLHWKIEQPASSKDYNTISSLRHYYGINSGSIGLAADTFSLSEYPIENLGTRLVCHSI